MRPMPAGPSPPSTSGPPPSSPTGSRPGLPRGVSRTGGTRSFMVPAHFIRILELLGTDGRAGPLQPVAHRPRRRPLPDRGQEEDDGSVSPHRDPRAVRGQRRWGDPDLPAGVAAPPRGVGHPGPAWRSASWTRTASPWRRARPVSSTSARPVAAVLVPQRRGGDVQGLAGTTPSRSGTSATSTRRLSHHYRPGLGHGAVGWRQHRTS